MIVMMALTWLFVTGAFSLIQQFHLLRSLKLGLPQIYLAPAYLRMGGLIDKFLGDGSIDIRYESESAALAADRISHDLRLLNLSKLLKVSKEVLICQRVVETSDEDFVADALGDLFGVGVAGAVTRTTAFATIVIGVTIII